MPQRFAPAPEEMADNRSCGMKRWNTWLIQHPWNVWLMRHPWANFGVNAASGLLGIAIGFAIKGVPVLEWTAALLILPFCIALSIFGKPTPSRQL